MARSAAIAARPIATGAISGTLGGNVSVSSDEIIAVDDQGGVNTPGRFAALDTLALSGEDVLDLDILYPAGDGTLAESVSFTVTLSDTDTGTLAEPVTLAQPITGSDAATLNDAPLVLTKTGSAPSDADSAILGQIPSIAATPATSDSATLAESATFPASVSDTDSGTLMEWQFIPTDRPPDSDVLTLVETTDILSSSGNVEQSSLVSSEAGTLADTSLLAINDPVPDSDSATLSETPANAVASSDTGTFAETASVLVTVVASDTGSLADTGTPPATPADTETAALAETGAVPATVTASDLATASDTGSITAPLPSADAGSLAESAAITAADTDADSGVFSEAVAALLAALSDSESESLADTPLVTAPYAFADTGAMTESSSITVTIVASETGALREVVASVPATLTATDQATEAEATVLGKGLSGVALGSVTFVPVAGTATLVSAAVATVTLLE